MDPLSPIWLNKRSREVQEIVIYCARSVKPRNITALNVGIQRITGAHERTVKRWFGEGINCEKGKFQPSHFQAMVEYLYRDKSISKEEIYSFAHHLGDMFENELNHVWAQLLFYDRELDSELPL